MPGSRAPAVLALVLALAWAASAGLSAAASAATAASATPAATVPSSAPTPPPSPVPTAIPSPLPTTLDPSPSPSPSPTDSPVDTITILSASIAPVSGGVQLSVTADSTTPIVTMNAHLLDVTLSHDILDPVMAQSGTGPDPDESTWTATITVGTAPTGLPLGNYDVTVDATDQGGTVLPADQTVTTLPFVEVPAITPNAVNHVFSYDNRKPVISGTVTTTGPGTGPAQPYADQPVFIGVSDPPGQGTTVLTNGSGVYTYSPQPGETYTVEVPAAMAIAGASAPPVAFTSKTDAVKMSASLTKNTVTYGGKVTVSGVVTYQPGGTFVPLHGLTVQVYYNRIAGSPVATAVTGKDGHFTAALPREASSVHWVLRAGGPYLTPATRTLPMKVSLPTVISGFQASLSQFWQVSFRGCLALAAGVPRDIPSLTGLTIQYAATPSGPWHTLGALPKQTSVFCGNGGRSFSGTLPAKVNYAYYRARYAGGTDSTGTGYLAAASGRVLAWKYEDRITSFSVSSRTVHKGGKLTAKGQLQYFSGKWRDYAGQKVYVILRPKGSGTWYYIATATTNSAGRFSSTFTDPVTAAWSAEFFGNGAHLATLAAMIDVAVT